MTTDRIAFSPLTIAQFKNAELTPEQSQKKAQLIGKLWVALKCPENVQSRLYERDFLGKEHIRIVFTNGKTTTLQPTGAAALILKEILTFPGAQTPATITSPAAAVALTTTSSSAPKGSVPTNTTDIAALQAQLVASKGALERAVAEKDTLTQQLTAKERAATAQLAGNQQAQESLKREVATLGTEKAALTTKQTELTAQSKALHEEVDGIKRSLSLAQTENAALTDTVETKKRVVQGRDAKISELTKQLESLRASSAELTTQNRALENKLSELILKQKPLESANLALMTELTSAQQTLAAANEKNSVQNGTIRRLEATVSELTQRINDLVVKLEKAEGLNNKISLITRRAEKAEERVAALTKAASGQEALEQQAAADAATIAELRRQLAAKVVSVSPAKDNSDEIAKIKKTVDDQMALLRRAQVENTQLTLSLDTEKQKSSSLEERVENLTAQNAKLSDAYEQQVQKQAAEIKTLREQIQKLTAHVAAFEILESKYLKTIRELEAEIVRLKASNTSLTNTVQNNAWKISESEHVIELHQKDLKKRLNDLSASRKEIEALKEKLALAIEAQALYAERTAESRKKSSAAQSETRILKLENERVKGNSPPPPTAASVAAATAAAPAAPESPRSTGTVTPEEEILVIKMEQIANAGLEEFSSPSKPTEEAATAASAAAATSAASAAPESPRPTGTLTPEEEALRAEVERMANAGLEEFSSPSKPAESA